MPISIANTMFYMAQYTSVRGARRPEPSSTQDAIEPPARETERLGRTLIQAKELQDSLLDLGKIAQAARTAPARVARVMATNDLGFGSAAVATIASSADIGLIEAPTPAVLRSSAEVNATPTSFTPFGPEWTSSTLQPTVSGAYNRENGTGTLTFKVDRGGTRGVDDLKIKVYDSSTNEIGLLEIKKEHTLDHEYTLDNGLALTFGQGDLVENETFTVDVSMGDPGSHSPINPVWADSSMPAAVGGVYNNANGTDTLTFLVDRGGTRGEDDLKIKVYDSSDNEIGLLDIKKEHALDHEYTLDNGLALTFGQGDLVEDDTFTVEVIEGGPASHSPADPVWAGSSAFATVGGVYDGTNGTDTLTFVVDREGTRGEDDLRIEVYDSSENPIDTIDIRKEDPLDQAYVLDNGLSVTIGAGFLRKNTSFGVGVFDTVGSAVDPNKPLDGTRDLDPNLESGFAVSPGSFEVNGVAVAVNAGDSMNDVLARIEALSIGVSASFDAATERVVFTQQTPGSAPSIVLGNDTTGFLAATKLAEAAVEPGLDRDAAQRLDSVGAFAAVASGAFSVNGVDIDIDTTADSLLDVLARINASGAGVTAYLDESGQRVSIESNQAGADLVLDSGTTGFFAALHIAEGTHPPSTEQGPDTALSSIAALSGVRSGAIELNGVGIAIDSDTDSLRDVIERINDSGAGLTATLIGTDARFRLTGQSVKKSLVVEEGATGFFSALGINEGVYQPTKARRGLSRIRARELTEAVGRTAESMNRLFARDVLGGARDPALNELRDQVERTVKSVFDPRVKSLETRFGLRLDFESDTGRIFDFAVEDQRRFQTAVRTRYQPVREFLVGYSKRPEGFVGGLSQLMALAYRDISAHISSGMLLSAFA